MAVALTGPGADRAAYSRCTSAPLQGRGRRSPCCARVAIGARTVRTSLSGFVETHGRPRTAEAIGTLEVVPRITVTYKGAASDMDVDGSSRAIRTWHSSTSWRTPMRPGFACETVAGHRGDPCRRHRRDQHDEHPAPGVGEGPRRADHRHHHPGDRTRHGPRRGRRGAVHRHHARSAAQAHEATATSTRPIASTPLWRTSSAPATWRRSARSVCVSSRSGSAAERGGVQAPPQDVIVAVSGRATAEQLIRRAVRLARRRRGLCTIVHVHEHATSPDADDVTCTGGWRRSCNA